MTRHFDPTRRQATLAVAGTTALALLPVPAAAQGAKSALNVAMIGEPQSLDPMASTADLVGIIMQHVYETLYALDGSWKVVPMLAEAMPTVSADGLRYAIPLRRGVKLHNGREMNAEDVVASLKRWMDMAPRGKALAKELAELTAKGTHAVELVLKNPYAPLLSQLALTNGMAAIMARESIANPLAQYIGTGPYQFKERRPDQYVLLTRFADYSARKEAPSGYGGKREALVEELRFLPVPNANTRVEGSLAGQYHFADQLPIESLPRLEKGAPKTMPVLTPSFGFPYLVLNTKEGVMASAAMRRALQMAIGPGEMLAAGFGDTRFFTAEGNHFPKGTAFYSTEGTAAYNERHAAKAKAAAEQAGYKGEAVRILTSRQYEFHHNMALIMAEQLKRAGFKAELNVVDWATLIQRRNDPKLWDLYITHSGLLPEPMLSPPQLGEGAPGWWNTPAKQSTLAAFNRESNPVKRAQLWGAVQKLVYEEVPYINVGKFSALASRSPALEGYQVSTWPYFWNVKLKS